MTNKSRKSDTYLVYWAKSFPTAQCTILLCFKLIRSFSIDDGDGSEKVTFKMNLRFFKLYHAYSSSLKMSNVDKFPWS